LKQSTTVADGPDPEEVLETLLGTSANGIVLEESQKVTISEADLDFDFDFGAMTLRQLAQDEVGLDGGNVYRSQTIEECMSHTPENPLSTPV
jgi:hypothetical protein